MNKFKTIGIIASIIFSLTVSTSFGGNKRKGGHRSHHVKVHHGKFHHKKSHHKKIYRARRTPYRRTTYSYYPRQPYYGRSRYYIPVAVSILTMLPITLLITGDTIDRCLIGLPENLWKMHKR